MWSSLKPKRVLWGPFMVNILSITIISRQKWLNTKLRLSNVRNINLHLQFCDKNKGILISIWWWLHSSEIGKSLLSTKLEVYIDYQIHVQNHK